MSKSDAEWAAWAKENRVSFQATPLVELRGHERVQVGFNLTLYGAVPRQAEAGDERRDAARRLKEEMREFLDQAVGSNETVARTEVQPSGMELVMRPENELRPEVSLTLRIFHADEYMKSVTAEEREGLSRFEKTLVAKGLRQGHW
jgi:hypothetical protein